MEVTACSCVGSAVFSALMENIVQKVTVGACVIRGGKVLLLRRAKDEASFPGLWEFPSGKREPFEPSVVGAAREVKEETGLDVEIGPPISVFEYAIKKPEETRDVTMVVFVARPKNSDEVKLSPAHDAFAWVRGDEIERYGASAGTKEAVRALPKLFELYPNLR